MAIALVETTPSSINYSKYFKFEFFPSELLPQGMRIYIRHRAFRHEMECLSAQHPPGFVVFAILGFLAKETGVPV